MGASITMVLLGAATSTSQLKLSSVGPLVAVAISFHLFAYLLNDFIDLPIDRTDPRRATSPLVMGLISKRAVLVIALWQVPVLVLLVASQGGGTGRFMNLIVLVGAVAIYDLWGKKSPLPPLIDLIQGVAWAVLGWLGAVLVGSATKWTVVLAFYFLAFIMLGNGVHGSIRDLANDRGHGARTTAALFGAGVADGGSVELGRGYRIYTLTLHAVTVMLPFVPFALGWYGGTNWWLVALMAACCVTSTVYLGAAIPAGDRHRQLVFGTRHLILVLAPLFVMLGPRLPGWAMVLTVGCYVLPFASYRWIFRPRPEQGEHWTVQTPVAQ